MGIICYITLILFFVLNELKILDLSFFDMFAVPIILGIICYIIFGLPYSIERVSKQNELDKNIKKTAIFMNSLVQTAKELDKEKNKTFKVEDDGG